LQENQIISPRTNNLNEYYESLRNNVITLLEHVRIPSNGTSIPTTNTSAAQTATISSTAPVTSSVTSVTQSGGEHCGQQHSANEKGVHDNFDSYLSKLQSMCAPTDTYCPEESRPIYDSVKSALQDFTVLPTPI
jgi:hypothetical protein